MTSVSNYSVHLLYDNFFSKLPREVLYLVDNSSKYLTGASLFQTSLFSNPQEFIYTGLAEISIVSAVLSLFSGYFLAFVCSIGTLSLCISGLQQQRTICELTYIVSDLKQTRADLRKVNHDLQATNNHLKERVVDFEQVNQSLKTRLDSLDELVRCMRQETGDLAQIKQELLTTKNELVQVEKTLTQKIGLLNDVTAHIRDECTKLSFSREQLTTDLSQRIDELNKTIETLKTFLTPDQKA